MNCICGNFEPRTTTNTVNTVIVCRNCGRTEPVTPMSTNKEEFEYCDNSGTHTISSNNILCCADTGRVVAVFYNERDLRAATGLIKKVELIDGKAYQFDVRSTGRIVNAIYSNNKFHLGKGQYFDVESADNIQLLVPQGANSLNKEES